MKNNRRNRKKLKMELRSEAKLHGYILDGAHVLGSPKLAKDKETIEALREMIRMVKDPLFPKGHWPKNVKAGEEYRVMVPARADGQYEAVSSAARIPTNFESTNGRFDYDDAGNVKFVPDPAGTIVIHHPKGWLIK